MMRSDFLSSFKVTNQTSDNRTANSREKNSNKTATKPAKACALR